MQRKFQQVFFIVAGFSYNGKLEIIRVEKMVKAAQRTVKRKFYVRYLQKKFNFYILMTYKKWNFIKTKLQVILRKLSLYSWKKWRPIPIFNLFLWSPMMFHLWKCYIVCGLLMFSEIYTRGEDYIMSFYIGLYCPFILII